MAVKPTKTSLQATSVEILNAIRNSASTNYRDYVPVANTTDASVRQVGEIIMTYPAFQNEFLSALVNRIGMVLITSKSYNNPWSALKRGMLEYGETIEEIFVNLAKPFEFDPALSESQIFKREIPDVRSAFHILNYKKFYKTTVSQEQLRQAFLSASGITDLITKIINSMYAGANYDEFQTMKYMIARHILDGRMFPVTIPTVNALALPEIVATIKGVSNEFTFQSVRYNQSGVYTYSPKEDQYIIVNSAFDAAMDVEVLAAAFNMDKAEFSGHRILVDSFGSIDTKRIDLLFGTTEGYKPLTEAELEALSNIPAVLVDRDWFMVLDNLANFTEQFNGEGLYWNYWYHVWKTFSVSPFANNALFVPGNPTVDSITVSPASATANVGQSVQLTANVSTEYFAPKSVNWTSSDPSKATVSRTGLVTILAGASGTVNITATSAFDSSKTSVATITIA